MLVLQDKQHSCAIAAEPCTRRYGAGISKTLKFLYDVKIKLKAYEQKKEGIKSSSEIVDHPILTIHELLSTHEELRMPKYSDFIRDWQASKVVDIGLALLGEEDFNRLEAFYNKIEEFNNANQKT